MGGKISCLILEILRSVLKFKSSWQVEVYELRKEVRAGDVCLGIIIICTEFKVMKLRDTCGDSIEYLAGSESKVNPIVSIFSTARGEDRRMT